MHKLYFISDIRKSNSSCQFFNGKKKYIATADVQNSKIVNFELVDFNNKPSRANLISEKGSVLFAKMQNTIKVLEINDDNCNNIYSTGFYSFKDERILPRYLRYYFESKLFNNIKDKHCQGATMKAINDDSMEKISINVPSINCQQIIIDKLYHINDLIKKNNFILERLDNIVKSQFIEMFSGKYRRKFLYQVCKELFAGGDIIKEVTSSKRDEKHPYPIYANGEKNNGLCGFTNMYRVDQEAVTISGRGTIGFVCLRNERFYPAVRLIVAIPNRQIINGCFLKHFIEYKNYGGQGASIPQLTVPMIRKELIPIPPIELQNQFASFVEQIDKSKYFGGAEYGIC